MKFLQNNAGTIREVAGLSTSAGSGDANKIIETNSAGKLDESFLPAGVGKGSRAYTASENISAGDFVNIHEVTGAPRIRKADATGIGKRAHGYVTAAINSSASGTVFFDDINPSLSGLTIGEEYFLSDTDAGKVTTSIPSGAGKICQKIGYALSTTEIQATIEQPIVLAA
ncbi:hypothetical protein DYBT9275_02789 [Dyadobacter sp. CECT 9275]|uniref:Uncharacterized protein n=1 Tax=Dyadobacter helix TaxID=2822344 RepID=A0A916JBG6_9BACT|nr:hypothetical protein [Dyadobacter sp. CECT 9275]CAG5002029.1 hypothetical protein DYBT9275_02789 [Dyadobacter sp. CECT 9275]